MHRCEYLYHSFFSFNLKSLSFFIETLKLTHGCDDEDILENVHCLYYNEHLDRLRDKYPDQIVPDFEFDPVSDIYTVYRSQNAKLLDI